MANVGTVSVVDEHGAALFTGRYATTALHNPDEPARRMTADVACGVAQERQALVGIVLDAAPTVRYGARCAADGVSSRGA